MFCLLLSLLGRYFYKFHPRCFTYYYVSHQGLCNFKNIHCQENTVYRGCMSLQTKISLCEEIGLPADLSQIFKPVNYFTKVKSVPLLTFVKLLGVHLVWFLPHINFKINPYLGLRWSNLTLSS